MKTGCMSKEVKFLFALLGKRKRTIIAILCLMVIIAVCNAALPFLSSMIIDDGMIAGSTNTIIMYASLFFIVSVIISIMHLCVEKLRINGYNNIQYELKEKVVSKLYSVHIGFFGEQSPTTIYHQTEEDVEAISGCFSEEFMFSVAKIIICLFLLPVLFSMNCKLTLITCLAVPLYYLKTICFAKIGYRTSKNNIDFKKEYSQWISEYVAGIQPAKCFMPFEYIKSKYAYHQKKAANAKYQALMFQEFAVRTEGVLIDLLSYILYIVGAYCIVGDEISVGQFISIQMYSLTLIGIIGDFLNVFCSFSIIKPSIERYQSFLSAEDEQTGQSKIKGVKPSIELKQVFFEYTKGNTIVNKVSAMIPYGMHIGINGGNGAGKTTLLYLLLRFLQPSDGEILMNGQSISKYDIIDYRHQFAYVPQTPYLLCDTIRNNICMYREVEEERLMDVIEIVGLSDLIDEKTLEYCVGQNGCELSGGQRQKISLARALINDAPILLLDEPETYLDGESKNILLRLLTDTFSTKTIIMISHNYELLNCMDSICEINGEWS